MSHNRRQSGLWERNDDGYFEQTPIPSAKIAVSGAHLPEMSSPSGPYSYYQPPPQQQEKRRTFSDRTIEDQLTPEKMVTSSHRPPLTIDPDYTPPSNLRSKAWSPGPESAISPRQQQQQQKGRQVSNASNKSEGIKRGSVPDKSPLQNLETWSKEEKRARAEVAEGKVRKGSTSQQKGGKRVGSGPQEQIDLNGRDGQEKQRNVSGPSSLGYRKAVGSGEKPNQVRPYDRGPEQQTQQLQQPQQQPVRNSMDSADLGRSTSGKYKRRSRDAGFAGAAEAAAAAPSISTYNGAADRGKAAYERRKSQVQSSNNESSVSPRPRDDKARRSSGKTAQRSGEDGAYAEDRRNVLLPKEKLKTPKDVPVNYTVPPQTVAAQQAHEQVGFGEEKHHHHFGGIFHREGHEHRGYQPSDKPLEEWRSGKVGKLTIDDLDLEGAVKAAQKPQKPTEIASDAAWWEKDQRSRRVSSSNAAKPSPRADIPQFDGPYEEQANGFQPRMFLKCGPLLRYTGMRREAAPDGGEKETWRGSVMILTEDAHCDLSSAPVLKMFRQDMDLHHPPPRHLVDAGNLPPDHEDPIAGQVKLSRTGRALYVRPVHDIDGEVDLSREENNQGLYSATRTSVLGPQGNPINPAARPSVSFQNKSRIKARDGEKLGRYREVKATRLHSERGHTFWRFNLEVELASVQTRVAYRINKGPAVAFWVPARGETMNVMFHSCNGFSMSVDSDTFSGPDPLWRDVLNRHQAKPFHVMLGGGDQIYNDAVMRDTTLFKDWLQMKNPESKHRADFTKEMQDELEDFYLQRYAMWFSQGLFGMATGQVPMVNIWDDHDIIDGFGSYPHHFQASRVFTGLGAIAHKYYMLFQHQSISTETEKDEPSWLLGRSPGPYIHEVSRNVFVSLGKRMSLLGLDCRTERMRDEILSQETYDIVFDRCRQEIIKGETKHLLVLLGVPIAYPRLNFLENILTSRVMDPIKALGRTGMLGGFVNKFDGGVEILDDLDDHWTAKHHKAERNWFIQELQELAKEKSARVTILGGDVHLAAVGRFFSKPEIGISRDRDWRYMPNVISSAIVNTPPPSVMADVLNKRNKVHWLDEETGEDMIPIFHSDVDGSKRNNNCLLPRRNFCVLGEYVPGHTPPSSPGVGGDASVETAREDRRRFPPGSMKRTLSLTRGPVSLVRRLSGSSKRRPSISRPSMDENQGRPVFDGIQRANSLGSHPPDGYGFPPRHVPPPSMSVSRGEGANGMQIERRPSYHRRPTDLTDKAARKAAARIGEDGNIDGRAPGEISLEGGLDVCLCVERDQKDPRGETTGYRLLVPALWYEPGAGSGPGELKRFSSHRKSLLERLKFNRKREQTTAGGEEYDQGSESEREEEDERLQQPEVRLQQQQLQPQQQQQPQPQQQQQQQLTQAPTPEWIQERSNAGHLLYAQRPQPQQYPAPQQKPAQYQLYPSTTTAPPPQSRYAQPQLQTQQYFQQPAQQPRSATQRSSKENGSSSAAGSMGRTNTGRGAITALPKRAVSGSAGYAAEPTSLPSRSVSGKQIPRASMDGYARPNAGFENGHGDDYYAKGFHGGGPPIGGAVAPPPTSQQGGKRNGEFPVSGYRRVSGPQQVPHSYPQQQQQQGRGGEYHVLDPQPNGRIGEHQQQQQQQQQQFVRRHTGNGLPLSSVPRDGEFEEDEDGYSSFSDEQGPGGRGYDDEGGNKAAGRRGSAVKAGKFFGIGSGNGKEDDNQEGGGSGKKRPGWMIWK